MKKLFFVLICAFPASLVAQDFCDFDSTILVLADKYDLKNARSARQYNRLVNDLAKDELQRLRLDLKESKALLQFNLRKVREDHAFAIDSMNKSNRTLKIESRRFRDSLEISRKTLKDSLKQKRKEVVGLEMALVKSKRASTRWLWALFAVSALFIGTGIFVYYKFKSLA